MTHRDEDIARAIRLRDVTKLVGIFFDNKGASVKAGLKTETELWDYKADCPHLGKQHFNAWAHLAKDVLAFHNHRGGIIFFGYSDDFRFVGATNRLDMSRLLQTKLRNAADASHIWWGVSVENKSHGLPRIDQLRKAKPAVAFLSVEPLLEDLGAFNLKGIHWVIVGGESGHGARPIEKTWVQSIRAQCRAQKVPFFFKQWGGVRKAEAGRELDGRTYDEFPDASIRPVPASAHRARLLETVALA